MVPTLEQVNMIIDRFIGACPVTSMAFNKGVSTIITAAANSESEHVRIVEIRK